MKIITFIIVVLLTSSSCHRLPTIGDKEIKKDNVWYKSNTYFISPPLGNYYSTVGYFDRILPIIYKIKKDTNEYKGFRYMVVRKGYCVDAERSFGRFYNKNKMRIYNVEKYYFY